jgi:hypothetical protein
MCPPLRSLHALSRAPTSQPFWRRLLQPEGKQRYRSARGPSGFSLASTGG